MKAKFQPAQQNRHAFEQNMLNPLQIAIRNKDSSLVALLLQFGADPNFAGMMAHQAPLYMALQHQQPLIVKSLLSHGARKYGPSTYTDETYNLLLVPLVQSQIEIFRDALSLFHIKTSAKDRRVAYSTLNHAVKMGRNDLILALIDAGCTIHGIWDPPLKNFPSPPAPSKPAPARSARVTRSATKPVPTPLPKYHRCLTSPAMQIALQNGCWNTVKMLLGLGAVWNYPYDYVLRRANESPEDVDKRLKELRNELALRDEEIERASVRVEEV
ncbi:Ankyrin repeat and SOCS box protein 7 [Neofusicoccum parvum]|nr:Ankyrin repeat and SOCS box protein 7 [Neofusicoccum parvum]